MEEKEPRNHWIGQLQMNDRLSVPFDFFFDIKELKNGLIIQNGSENLFLKLKKKKDSIIAYFKEIDAQLVYTINQKSIRGYWINHNKKNPIKIPFSAYKTNQNKFEIPIDALSDSTMLKNHYKVKFLKTNKWSIGKFKSKNGAWEGTFMTETGDYRFFSGYCFENKFKLSSFNGNWAMLVQGEIYQDSIHGILYSGVSFSTEFDGEFEPTFKLGNPNELTSVVNDESFNFIGIKTLRNSQFDYSKNNGKVVIYQIMGTWCPNCIDEMNYYKELTAKYQKQGLTINALAYEIPQNNVKSNLKKLKKFKKRMKLNYPIYFAGKPSTELASSHFPMLNRVMSYPTSIVLDKKGNIRKVHTGFNGPATGLSYEQFKIEMDDLIKQILNE